LFCVNRKEGESIMTTQTIDPNATTTTATTTAAPAQTTNQDPSNLLTVAEVATILRVDATTVRRWVKCGVLPAVALPHARKRQSYRIKRETLALLLENSTKLQPGAGVEPYSTGNGASEPEEA
jgi:excisionase family DNA binding protein